MSGTDLIFSRPPATGMPVRLVFGETDGADPGIPDVTLQGAGQITGLRLRVALHSGALLQGAGTITGLRLRVAVVYDVAVSRPTVTQAAARYQEAAPIQAGTEAAYRQALSLASGAASHWQDARATGAAVQALWQDCERLAAWARHRWQDAAGVPTAPVRSPYQEAQRLRTSAAARYQEAAPLPVLPLGVRYQETLHLRLGGTARYQEAVPLRGSVTSRMGIAVPVYFSVGGRYQEAWPPRPGRNAILPPEPPQPDPCYLPVLPAQLLFQQPADSSLPARLVFICERHGTGPEPGATVVVPTQRVYIVLNQASLRRVDGDIAIPTFDMSMSLDMDSWAWGFSASVPHSALSSLQPSSFGDPVELEARINGVPYRFFAEQLSTTRSFGNEALRISGRGLTATLDSPYAVIQNFGNTDARTAQQLMADVLTINGVPFGWDVEFGLQDWLVPGGVWTHQGSYIGALNNIVQAAGGYLQPHASAKTLRALRQYPTAPWEWDSTTPDFELPAAVTVQEGIAWRENPRYNRVYVSGTSAGVLGQITRAGTDGATLAPMATDPLITHADAARQRGIRELAAGGRQATVTLQLPVLGATGIIPPGKMVRYVDGSTTRLGITRSVQVDVRMPEISQQIEVETYA